MPKYKMVLFDSDGTLADTLPWLEAAFNELATRHGIKPISETDREALRPLSTRHLLQRLNIPLWRIPAFVAGMRRHMAGHIDEFSLFEGIAESLRQLHTSGVTLGIVSSNSRDNVRHILGPSAAFMSHYACGASLLGKAPKLRAALKASGLPARQAIYIGDEIRDAEAARKVGMAYGAVAWGYHSLSTLQAEKPEEFFTKPGEIGQKLA